jgi:hypothetical protein
MHDTMHQNHGSMDTTVRKKTVVLHVGPPKTGTTSIQRFLYQARHFLAEHGLLYANSGRLGKGQQQTVLRHGRRKTLTGPGYSHNLLPLSLLGETEHLSADECWRTLVTEVKETPLSTVVVSSEAFARLKESHLHDVRQYLSSFDVRVIATLRQPFERMLSDYTQRVKTGRYCNSFASFVEDNAHLVTNYDQFIHRWDAEFGECNVRLLRFEGAQDGPGLENRFVALLLGHPARIGQVLPRSRLNTSPSPRAMNRLLAINRAERAIGHPAASLRMFSALRRIVIDFGTVSKLIDRIPGNAQLYTERDQDRVAELAADSYANLAKRCG